ncbi:2956_t:CDS:1 [Acaulospora morrowiae]|uniref:2956_t:CDS:1 n=1 Tax=Acaulospora morrowiae TaxID=94023 RepID=A0A9N8ZDB8_9GLOM|nr:2956_t:CDS:1 [Acaulospora morrowiae]
MGDIPAYCPSDYPYQVPITLQACQIRLANFICMWLYYASLILLIPTCWSLQSLADKKNLHVDTGEYSNYEGYNTGWAGIGKEKSGKRKSFSESPKSSELIWSASPLDNNITDILGSFPSGVEAGGNAEENA